ncbi:DUF6531 domain-containing protein [Microbulbifer sp. YPW1]|uniref:DUF6531 domain-containing protein n=1 Tax=Microbulbifer sp. YPW1 TaxID=2745199 RepID=UPI00159A3269|nr:DUF6531 domain-containing protein [Microbulbifer sp. YPW1]QKX16449.1 RHS repeat protein [Microbulbifer sp. YPW1]
MTPESLVGFIPSVLADLAPPRQPQSPGDVFAICKWLRSPENGTFVPFEVKNPLWPDAPIIKPNDYCLANFSNPAIFHLPENTPVQLCNYPGTNFSGELLPTISQSAVVCGHVIAANGEVAFSRTDFVLPGPFNFSWQRFYRQSADDNLGLGTGWRHTLSEHLQLPEPGSDSSNKVVLNTAEGRSIVFDLPAIGHGSFNRSERLCLLRQSLHSFRISAFDQPDKIFRADGAGRNVPLSEIRDSFGNTLTVDYQDGRPHKIVTSWGRTLDFVYREGLLQEISDIPGNSEHAPLCAYQFDDNQYLRAVASSHGGNKTYSARRSEAYGYAQGKLSELSSDDAGHLTFTYDRIDRCRLLSVDQHQYLLRWSSGRRTCTLSSDDQHDIQWQFDTRGNTISRRQQGRETRRRYDHYRNLCLQVDSAGTDTVFRHDEFGRLVRCTRHGVHQHYIYDTQGRLLAAGVNSTDGPTAIWKLSYQEHSRPTQVIDPAGNHWHCDYDDKGQLRQLKDPEDGCVRLHWDAQSQLRELQRGDRQYHWQYDERGRPRAFDAGTAAASSWEYDTDGTLCKATLDAQIYTLRYDDHRRPCAIECDGETRLQWQYDDRGLVRHIRFAAGISWDLDYNHRRQLNGLRTGNSQFCWQYDAFGQLNQFFGDGDHQQREWQYDHGGRVTEYRDSDNHWFLEYNATGTLDQIRNNNGQQCSFHFDIHGRLLQATNDSCTLRYRYDQRDLLIAEHRDLLQENRSESLSISHQYDNRGWLRSSSSDSLNVTYTFAACGNLYGIDANGKMVLRCEQRDSSEAWSLGEHEIVKQYETGLLTGITLNGQHQLHPQYPQRPAHIPSAPVQFLLRAADGHTGLDPRGNVVDEVRSGQREAPRYHYQYDGWGLLHSAECGDFKTYFHYDPFGRRVGKISTHRRSRRQQRVFSHWSGLGLWGEVTARGGQQSSCHYLHHPITAVLVARALDTSDSGSETDKLQYYVTDDRGQLLAVLGDSERGDPIWQRKTSESAANTPRGPGSYRGREGIYDVETQLVYREFCYWHPANGTEEGNPSPASSAPLDIGQGRLMALHRDTPPARASGADHGTLPDHAVELLTGQSL